MTEVIELDDALTYDSEDTPTSTSNNINNGCSLPIQLRSQFELIRSIHKACGDGNASSEERDKPFVEEVSVLSSSWDSDFEEFESPSPPKCSSEQDLRQLKLKLAISTALKVESEIASLSAGISELESLFFQQEQEHDVQDKIDGRGYGNMYQNDVVMCDEMKRSENQTEE